MEILLVVGIIAILAGIVIVAVNPSKQLATVRNTERKSDIKQLDSAITQYYIDNFRYPSGITGDLKGICNTGSLSTTTGSGIVCTNLVDLTSLVPTYITAIPTDPQSTTTNTGYYVTENSTTHKIGVRAELAELDQDININAASSTTFGGGGLGISGLVAHYKMNDTDGTTVLDNTSNNDGTGTYTPARGKINGALEFGGSDRVDTGITNLPTDFSIATWVKITGGSGWRTIVAKSSSAAGMQFLIRDNSSYNVYFSLSAGAVDVHSDTRIDDGLWHQVVVTYVSGNAPHLYIDGVLNEDGSTAGSYTQDTTSMWLGYNDDSGRWMVGNIDDVRIYSKALSGPVDNCTSHPNNEICQIYNSGAGTEAE